MKKNEKKRKKKKLACQTVAKRGRVNESCGEAAAASLLDSFWPPSEKSESAWEKLGNELKGKKEIVVA